ncbi:unnamed protein product [Boreogadus saida]
MLRLFCEPVGATGYILPSSRMRAGDSNRLNKQVREARLFYRVLSEQMKSGADWALRSFTERYRKSFIPVAIKIF